MLRDKKRMLLAAVGACVLMAVLVLVACVGNRKDEPERKPIRMGVKSVEPTEDSSDFVMLSDVAPDILQEIRYYTTYNFMGKQMIDYDAPVALLTKESADALFQVNEKLKRNGYCLKVYDAYRPQGTVDAMYQWSMDETNIVTKKSFYPNIDDKKRLFREGYLNQQSAYTRGSTVAVTLVDLAAGREVDMGSTFDYFDEISLRNSDLISEEQRANRNYLEKMMKDGGFIQSGNVWWQFTLVEEPYPETYFEFPVDVLTKEVYF